MHVLFLSSIAIVTIPLPPTEGALRKCGDHSQNKRERPLDVGHSAALRDRSLFKCKIASHEEVAVMGMSERFPTNFYSLSIKIK